MSKRSEENWASFGKFCAVMIYMILLNHFCGGR